MKKIGVVLGLLLTVIVGANAKELRGVTLPDQKQVDGTTLVLNGLGTRQATAFKVNVYVAGLYVAQASSDPSAILSAKTPKEISLRFLRDVSGSDLSKAWEEGFAKNSAAELPALKERIAKFKGLMADMKKGGELTFTCKPGAGVHVTINGAAKGTIEGDDFAKALLSIWLGANPPNPELKAGLLGKS